MKLRGSRLRTRESGRIMVSPRVVRITRRCVGVMGPAPNAHDITPGDRSLMITKKAEQHPILSVVELGRELHVGIMYSCNCPS